LEGIELLGGEPETPPPHQMAPPVPVLKPLPVKSLPRHVLALSLKVETAGKTAHMVWKDGDAQAVHVTAIGGASAAELCQLSVDDGVYPVTVRATSFSEAAPSRAQGADYELTVRDMLGAEGMEIEPNDTNAQPDGVAIGSSRTGFIGRPGDVDVYAVDVLEVPSKRVTIQVGPHPLNLSFRVTDDEGGLIAEVRAAGPGGVERRALDLPPGRYFVQVQAEEGSSCAPYVIEAQ
ncbi:MAG: hypothetical protein AAGI01_11205, partial [Myxococcota bacterium]